MTDFALPGNVLSIPRYGTAKERRAVNDRLMPQAIIASGLGHLLLALGVLYGPLLFASAPSARPLPIDVTVVDISELETVVPPLAVPRNDEPKARAIIPPPPSLTSKPEQSAPREEPKVERAKVVQRVSVPREVVPPAAAPVTSGAASIGGGSDAVEKARVNYQDMVASMLARAKRYPERAVRHHVTGRGVIRLKLDAAGAVVSAEVATSTQSSILDEELLRMVERAAPFPAFPPTMSHSHVALLVPVAFRLEP